MSRLDAVLDPFREERMRLDLAPMTELLERLGRPDRSFPVVLVAGTNGKGTVAAMLAAGLAASGVRTGLYTSPHLEEARERIRVDGRVLDEGPLIEAIRQAAAAAPTPPTYFEVLTAAALLAFRQAAVDLAVLEIGLGGRLDATNATRPCLSIVTSIDRDHEALLGAAPEAIAREKAGIFRRGVPALIAEDRDPARSVLLDAARSVGAMPALLAPEAPSHGVRARLEAIAVRAAELLGEAEIAPVDRTRLAAALRDLWWPGRDERVALPAGPAIWLDTAHNPAAAERLAERVRADASPWALLFGCLADKDAAGMLEPLVPVSSTLYFVDPEGTSRGLAASRLEGLARNRWPAAAGVAGPLPILLDRALGREQRILVTGSFRVVGPARRRLRSRFGVPAPAIDPLFPPAQTG